MPFSSHRTGIAIIPAALALVLLTALFPARLPAAAISPVNAGPGLLFHLSGERGFEADFSAGNDAPVFIRDIERISDAAVGAGFRCPDFTQIFAFDAPGNIYAAQGTLSFFFRSRYPYGNAPFKIFQTSYCDHTSFDMVWLRIDYNGSGFDAFVTDANLARVRVSVTPPQLPGPDRWTHFALAWDQTAGIRFYLDGRLAARRDTASVFDAGLGFFGTHGYLINPLNVSSGGSDIRGGDFDEFRIYDRMLSPEQIARLARGEQPKALAPLSRDLDRPEVRDSWMLRWGWNRPGDIPPELDSPVTTVRKVEIHNAYDLKQWLWKGCDGIRETTWPGVYNRSRLPGRTDYFILPDWNCYSTSGRSVTFTLPEESWNHVEISGAAWGQADVPSPQGAPAPTGRDIPLFSRPAGQERTVHRLPAGRTGGMVRFTNQIPETPIGEFMVYHVSPETEPQGRKTLSYTVTGGDGSGISCLDSLRGHIAGRHLPDERTVAVALPEGTVRSAAAERTRVTTSTLPIVHILIPCEHSGVSWNGMAEGLDGIAIDLPPLAVAPTHGKYFPLNIQIRDPLWPNRSLLDFSFSVQPGQRRTIWLDTRDRILPFGQSLYLLMAGAGADFGVSSLREMRIRLVFTDRERALREHEIDRFTQVRDNYGHIIESRPRDHRLALYDRFFRDVNDLLTVNPGHLPGMLYAAHGIPGRKWPDFEQPAPPPGVPLWAFRQVEYLKLIGKVILWWIDNRQIENGEFGGGLSDDSDMTHSWPIPALMGVEPEKIAGSLHRELDAIYANGMLTDGLNTALMDALHTTEEGTNVQAQLMHLEYGDPELVERIMETARAFERITGINAAGHRHFRSSYFSATRVVDEEPWLWTVQQTFRLLHPGLSLVEFNGHPRAKKLLLEMADGLIAHRKQDAEGKWHTPGTIHFRTDEDQPGDFGAADHLFWGAWCWTGESKYLQPLLDGGPKSLGRLNANALDLLGRRDEWGKGIAGGITPSSGNDFARTVAWQTTGDTRFLEGLYADQIRDHSQRMYFMTEGQFWTDRLDIDAVELQRTRLGGVARRSKSYIYPGHVVSWSFPRPCSWAEVAILVPRSNRGEFQVIGYNLSGQAVTAVMTAWDIDPGEWEMTRGTDTDGNGAADRDFLRKRMELERTESMEIVFPPREQVVLNFRLLRKGTPYWVRPDLGIGPRDIRIDGNDVRVRVHSLGSVDSPAGKVELAAPNGKILAAADVPPLPAPLDYTPSVADVTIRLPRGTVLEGCSVRLRMSDAGKEITRMNNRVNLGPNGPERAWRVEKN